MNPLARAGWTVAVMLAPAVAVPLAQQTPKIPSTPLTYGFFTARFAPDGALTVQGTGWPALTGTWKAAGDEVTEVNSGPKECAEAGRYTFRVEATHMALAVVADPCVPRRMILDLSD